MQMSSNVHQCSTVSSEYHVQAFASSQPSSVTPPAPPLELAAVHLGQRHRVCRGRRRPPQGPEGAAGEEAAGRRARHPRGEHHARRQVGLHGAGIVNAVCIGICYYIVYVV